MGQLATTPERLRAFADRVIGPAEGGYLRPWMCQGDAITARVFLVGANPATPFPTSLVERDDYLDALVGGGQAFNDLYLRARTSGASPTRRNITRVVGILNDEGVVPVLETNVWSLPKKSLAALRVSDHDLVTASSRVLAELTELLDPKVVIVHGAMATRELATQTGRDLRVADRTRPLLHFPGSPFIFALPSLSPPPANAWLPSAEKWLRELAREVAQLTCAT